VYRLSQQAKPFIQNILCGGKFYGAHPAAPSIYWLVWGKTRYSKRSVDVMDEKKDGQKQDTSEQDVDDLIFSGVPHRVSER